MHISLAGAQIWLMLLFFFAFEANWRTMIWTCVLTCNFSMGPTRASASSTHFSTLLISDNTAFGRFLILSITLKLQWSFAMPRHSCVQQRFLNFLGWVLLSWAMLSCNEEPRHWFQTHSSELEGSKTQWLPSLAPPHHPANKTLNNFAFKSRWNNLNQQ